MAPRPRRRTHQEETARKRPALLDEQHDGDRRPDDHDHSPQQRSREAAADRGAQLSADGRTDGEDSGCPQATWATAMKSRAATPLTSMASTFLAAFSRC